MVIVPKSLKISYLSRNIQSINKPEKHMNNLGGESIQDLFRCTIDLIYDINLLQDKSYQKNKVTGKFIKILFNQNTAFRSSISPYLIVWNKISRYPSTVLRYDFNHDILDIYNSLHDLDVSPHTNLSKQKDGSHLEQYHLPSPSAYQTNIKTQSQFRTHSSPHHQRRQPRKHRSDAEGLLHVSRQHLDHTNDTCPLLHPENIKVQDIRESLVQECAKNLPCAADPDKDFKRKGPRYAMIHQSTAWNANVDKY
eukprot:7744454-Ditylum_brightwellii.AAC.1